MNKNGNNLVPPEDLKRLMRDAGERHKAIVDKMSDAELEEEDLKFHINSCGDELGVND